MGGGGIDIDQRSISDEWPSIKKLYRGQENQYGKWRRKDPILAGLYSNILDFMKSPESPILAELQKQGLDVLKGGPSELLTALTGRGMDLLKGPSSLLQSLQTDASQALATGGKLTPEQERDATLRAQALSAGAGMGNTSQGLARALLNRDQYVQGRLNTARQYATGVEGLSEADIANRLGLASGIEGLGETDLARRFGLATGAYGTKLQDIAARTQLPESVLQTGVNTFSQLTNPILAYASDLFSSNQNAQAASQIAGANKSSGATGGALGAIGSIIPAIIGAIPFSDEDLKEDITDTGELTVDGVPVKRWKYKGGTIAFESPIAQDVEEVMPGAVGREPITGYRAIDLSQIDAPFRFARVNALPQGAPRGSRVLESPLLMEI